MLDITSEDTWVYSPAEFRAAFSSAESGSAILYAVGDLRHARESTHLIGTELGTHAEQTGKYAYSLYEQGRACLTQNKLGPNKFEYMCTKR